MKTLLKTKKIKCKNEGCDNYFDRVIGSLIQHCSQDCAYDIAIKKLDAKRKKDSSEAVKQAKEAKAKRRDEDKKIKLEYSRKKRLDVLQDLVNQFVLSIRDAEKGCYTCGTQSQTIKYDAGHCFTRKARADIRYELTNIHKQCSVNCNQFASGAVEIYKSNIVRDYGQEGLDYLEQRKPDLKVQFPDSDSIEAEIKRWRAVIRSHGLKPYR